MGWGSGAILGGGGQESLPTTCHDGVPPQAPQRMLATWSEDTLVDGVYCTASDLRLVAKMLQSSDVAGESGSDFTNHLVLCAWCILIPRV